MESAEVLWWIVWLQEATSDLEDEDGESTVVCEVRHCKTEDEDVWQLAPKEAKKVTEREGGNIGNLEGLIRKTYNQAGSELIFFWNR